MAEGLVSMSDQFQGLPIESLIGGPLQAACKANLMLAKSTADYINTVGFNPPKPDGTPGDIRNVDFLFEKPGQREDGSLSVDEIHIKVPMLAIVPIPNLQIDTVDITFDMEVKSSTSDKETSSKEGSFGVSAKGGWGPFSVEVNISGKAASSRESTRASDNSAKYHIEVRASNAGIPEGLARVLDMMAQAAAPRKVVSKGVKEDGTVDESNKIVNPQAKKSIAPTPAPAPIK